MTMLLDTRPDAEPHVGAPPDTWATDPVPSNAELLSRTLVNYARRPQRFASFQLRAMREVAKVTRSVGLSRLLERARPQRGDGREISGSANEQDRPPLLPNIAAPRTPFNRPITPHRRFAFRSVPLDDVKQIKNALGATLNDVVMAVCAGALRRYLIDHDALPDKCLVSGIPVSIRTGVEEDRWTNRVSMMIADLPTDTEDPVQRVRDVHDTMVAAKGRFDMIPADTLVDLAEQLPAALATRAMRLGSRLRITDRLNPPINLIISNVPGPRHPLYLGGARLKHFYPVSTVVDGQGLNMTVQSYLDTLDFGFVSCRELVPDLWTLVDYCVDEVEVLKAACGLTAPAPKAASKKAASGKAAAKKAAPTKTKPEPARTKPKPARTKAGTR